MPDGAPAGIPASTGLRASGEEMNEQQSSRVRSAYNRGLWLNGALEHDGRAPCLTGDVESDVCIVGGGYTGLWAAIAIKEQSPSTSVTIVEADVCGGGASGQNGGFALTFWHSFLGLQRLCGTQEALRLCRESEIAVAEIGDFCRKHGIDAAFRYEGWLWSATNAHQVNAWESTVAALEAENANPFVDLSPDEVKGRTGSARHVAGVFEPGCASLDPAALVRGLRRVALDLGVRIHELTPMLALDRSDPPRVRTPEGSVTASRVVIATNAWASRLPELYGSILCIASDVVSTARLPEGIIDGEDFMNGTCVSDSRLMVNYYRTTVDGRVVFGKGGGAFAFGKQIGGSFRGPSRRAEWVTRAMRAIFPSLENVPISESWVGAVDRSLDGLPFFTDLGRPDLICGAGFSGNGVGPSRLGGKILASMALGRDDGFSSCGLVRKPVKGLPPEPIRGVGGRLVRSAIARKELAEDEGRRPGFVDRSLARLAPPGLVPLD